MPCRGTLSNAKPVPAVRAVPRRGGGLPAYLRPQPETHWAAYEDGLRSWWMSRKPFSCGGRVPAHEDRRAGDRQQARDRRLLRSGVSPAGPRHHRLPRTARRSHRDRYRPVTPMSGVPTLRGRPCALGAADPLTPSCDGSFPVIDSDVIAYFDGNSLGRPPRAATAGRHPRSGPATSGGGRLIRGWGEGWMDLPERVGDRLASVALGAAPGQTVIRLIRPRSTLYKVVHAAAGLCPHRRDYIVIDRANFPTDRFVVEAVAAARGMRGGSAGGGSWRRRGRDRRGSVSAGRVRYGRRGAPVRGLPFRLLWPTWTM